MASEQRQCDVEHQPSRPATFEVVWADSWVQYLCGGCVPDADSSVAVVTALIELVRDDK